MRNRARAAMGAQEPRDVEKLAVHAVDFSCPELAVAAEAFLQRHYQRGKAEEAHLGQARVGPLQWGADDEPGRGDLELDR